LKPEVDLSGKNFLVTGGAGFIGSHLVRSLLERRARVVSLDDYSNGKESNLPMGDDRLEKVNGDVRSFDFSTLGKLDCVFNEAARALLPSFEKPVDDMVVNAGGTVRILEYALKTGVKVVHASSGSVYGNPLKIPISEEHPLNPISPYGVSKLASEYYCSMYHGEFSVEVTMLRYFNVYGPRQTVSEEMGVVPIFVKKALRNEPLRIFGDGKQTRDFLNVRDVVSANLLSYTSDQASGEIMNVGGGGKEVSILELANLVKDLCDSKSEIIFAEPKPGDIRRLSADSTKANRLVGYAPSVSLEDGLREYIEYAKS
jgi:UDP-glucose 4-epimerase